MQTERMSIPQKETFNYPLKVKHIFLTFLQEFCSFQHPSTLMYYNPNDLEKSNILIFDSYAHDLEQRINQKPCVIFSRGPLYVVQNTLYDNLLRQESRTYVDPSTQNKYEYWIEKRTFLFAGQVEWRCCSRQGLEAEAIASVIAMLHHAHKQVLREKGLHDIKTIQIGEEMLAEGDVEPEVVIVPVSIAFELQAFYEFWENADMFNRANIKGTTEDNDLILHTDP